MFYDSVDAPPHFELNGDRLKGSKVPFVPVKIVVVNPDQDFIENCPVECDEDKHYTWDVWDVFFDEFFRYYKLEIE